MKSQFIATLVSTLILAVPATPSFAQSTPLPSGLTITRPDSSVPDDVAIFAGKWVGTWGPGNLDSTLVVYRIHPASSKGVHKAEVVYSWGTYSPWYILTPGYAELEGEIKGGRLVIITGRLNLQYQLSEDRKSLSGFYRTTAGTPGTFRRVEE